VLGRRLDAEDQFSCIQGESPFLPAPERGDATHRGGGSFTTIKNPFLSLQLIEFESEKTPENIENKENITRTYARD
jgi:hypothetical protein